MSNHKPAHLSCRRMPVRRLLIAALAGAVVLGPASAATTEKAIELVTPAPAPAPVTAPATDLEVDFDALRTSYRVNEPIRFRVRGNKDFYLYLYTVDAATGAVQLLLPNRLQKDNHYPAGRDILVPNRELEAYADSPGRERVIMLATRDDPGISLDRFELQGDLYSTKDKELQSAFAEKDIRIREGSSPEQGAKLVVAELELTITGEPLQLRPATDRPVALVATARPAYHAGERFEVVLGADRDGWIHLYVRAPGGAYERLARVEVAADRLRDMEMRAVPPYGRHQLVALYSPKKTLDPALVAAVFADPTHLSRPRDDALGMSVAGLDILER